MLSSQCSGRFFEYIAVISTAVFRQTVWSISRGGRVVAKSKKWQMLVSARKVLSICMKGAQCENFNILKANYINANE